MKEKFIVITAAYCSNDTAYNKKGECSTQYIVFDNEISEFDSYEEAQKVIEKVAAIEDDHSDVKFIFEIKKVYIK